MTELVNYPNQGQAKNMNSNIDGAIAHTLFVLVISARCGITDIQLANQLSASHKAYLFKDKSPARYFSILRFLESQNVIRVLSYYAPPDSSKFKIFASSQFLAASANDEAYGQEIVPDDVQPKLTVVVPENKVISGNFKPKPR
jgi:hypothetical protein